MTVSGDFIPEENGVHRVRFLQILDSKIVEHHQQYCWLKSMDILSRIFYIGFGSYQSVLYSMNDHELNPYNIIYYL